jgi:transcriptional regulator with XRE-family HTH domain
MIVRKLRLQRGWSQEHLVELTGLSARTVQRIERGQTPSLESKTALAAVFEVDVSTFDDGGGEMANRPIVSREEAEAMEYVKGLKEFHGHVGM